MSVELVHDSVVEELSAAFIQTLDEINPLCR